MPVMRRVILGRWRVSESIHLHEILGLESFSVEDQIVNILEFGPHGFQVCVVKYLLFSNHF